MERNSDGEVESVTFHVSVHDANVLTISHDILSVPGPNSPVMYRSVNLKKKNHC